MIVSDPVRLTRKADMNQEKMITVLTDCGAIESALRTEHEAIDSALETLKRAMLAGANTVTLTRLMDVVLDFCVAHFASEEQEFRAQEYPKLASHVRAHRALTRRFRETRAAISNGQIEHTLSAYDLLNLFHDHVDRFDRPAHIHLLNRRIARHDGDSLQQQIELEQLTRA
jgi:hemerythrin-like metal-binding protein